MSKSIDQFQETLNKNFNQWKGAQTDAQRCNGEWVAVELIFGKRSKFFVKSFIMASSCHNLNIQIGLQRNRLGGEEVVSKANLQI